MSKTIKEFRHYVRPNELLKYPDIALEVSPFNISTHTLANSGWEMRIISQEKHCRYGFRTNYSHLYKSCISKTRVCFMPFPHGSNSSIHFKFPFYVGTVNDLMERLAASKDVIYKSTLGLKINIYDIKRDTKKDWWEYDSDIIQDLSALVGPDAAKEQFKQVVLNNVTEKFTLGEVMEAFGKKIPPPKRTKSKPDMSNVIDISKWKTFENKSRLSEDEITDILKKFG